MCQAGRIQFKCNMHDTLRTIILCFPNLVQVVVPWTELGESLEPVRKFYFRQACIRSNVDQVADEMVWKQDLTMRYRRGGNWQWDIMVVGGTGMTTRMWRLRNSNFRCEFHSQTELWISMILIPPVTLHKDSFFVEMIQNYLICRLSRQSFEPPQPP